MSRGLDDERDPILMQRAVEVWGVRSQLDQAQEEMAECIVAINHLRRGRIEIEELAEEMADALLCFDQLEVMWEQLGPLIKEAYIRKRDRLESRVIRAEKDLLEAACQF